MKTAWPWIFGIAVGLLVITLLLGGRSERSDYWIARGSVPRAVQVKLAEDIAFIRFPCGDREGSIQNTGACGFYVWKK